MHNKKNFFSFNWFFYKVKNNEIFFQSHCNKINCQQNNDRNIEMNCILNIVIQINYINRYGRSMRSVYRVRQCFHSRQDSMQFNTKKKKQEHLKILKMRECDRADIQGMRLIIDFEISKIMNGKLIQQAFHSRNIVTRHVSNFLYNVLNNQVSIEIYL